MLDLANPAAHLGLWARLDAWWSGGPVRAVVEALGGLDGSRPFMTGTGGEKLQEGVDPKSVIVERSVPVAVMGDAILAWETNGAPVSLAGMNVVKKVEVQSMAAKAGARRAS